MGPRLKIQDSATGEMDATKETNSSTAPKGETGSSPIVNRSVTMLPSTTHSETHVLISICTPQKAYPRLYDAILSTKYFDDESELVYWWLSRDPITEKGGLNLYAFAENAAVTRGDALGQFSMPSLGGLAEAALAAWSALGSSLMDWNSSELEAIADTLPSAGLQTAANATIFTGIAAGGLNAQFFPSTCEVGFYSYILGLWESSGMSDIGEPNEVFGEGNLSALAEMNWGVAGSIGIEPMVALPFGPGEHDADSWRGYFFGATAGPVSGWGSDSWGGLSFVIGPGGGVEYNVAYYRWLTDPAPSVVNVQDLPLVGGCLCSALRKAAQLSMLDEVGAVLDVLIDSIAGE